MNVHLLFAETIGHSSSITRAVNVPSFSSSSHPVQGQFQTIAAFQTQLSPFLCLIPVLNIYKW